MTSPTAPVLTDEEIYMAFRADRLPDTTEEDWVADYRLSIGRKLEAAVLAKLNKEPS